MTDEIQTEEKAVNGALMLTVLVDLSHPSLADRGLLGRIALSELLSGLSRSALHGADASIVTSKAGETIGVYMLAPDDTGEGREALKLAAEAIAGDAFHEAGRFGVSVKG